MIAGKVGRIRQPVRIVTGEGYGALAKTYQFTPLRRAANVLMRLLLRLGLALRTTMLLTVPGRRSGTLRSTPVTLVESEPRPALRDSAGEGTCVGGGRTCPQSLRGTGSHHPTLFR